MKKKSTPMKNLKFKIDIDEEVTANFIFKEKKIETPETLKSKHRKNKSLI